jgi:hypothetical protein
VNNIYQFKPRPTAPPKPVSAGFVRLAYATHYAFTVMKDEEAGKALGLCLEESMEMGCRPVAVTDPAALRVHHVLDIYERSEEAAKARDRAYGAWLDGDE